MDINSIINVPSTDSPPKLPKISPETSMSQPPYHGSKASARRLSSKDGKQKVFQCTGFGDCKMIFTRSEHLARHARKHTGEKPFQCVVPTCNRMFSRFDNMMQHTQTHSHRRDHSKQPITLDGDLRRIARKSSVSSNSSMSSSVSERPSSLSQLPSPQPTKPYPIQIPPSPVSPHHQHRYLPPLTIPSPNHSPWNSPLPVSPVSPISPYSQTSFSPIPSLAPLSMSSPPTHSRTLSQPDASPPRAFGHGPRTASDPTPFIYTPAAWFDDHNTPPPTSPTGRPPARTRTGRRLSIADLCNPIETLMQPAAVRGTREGAIEITEDEMEALLGFSQFHSFPVKKEEMG